MPHGARPTARPGRTTGAALIAAAITVSGIAMSPRPASAATRWQVTSSAATYARGRGYTVGVAVLDTRTGLLYSAGDAHGSFASESIVKVLIAARLLESGRMHGPTARTAWKMITQSDDGSASALYPSVGGDGLEPWAEQHFHVPGLGGPPHRANWWGNTHLTPIGLVQLYAALKRDRRVAPWLLRAMHHATTYGSDGTYQFFGLPSATVHPAIKQGWGADYDDWGASADFNTSGYVDGDRYAVAVLARGPAASYGARIAAMLTATVRRLLPGGSFPDPNPTVAAVSPRTAPLLGGTTVMVSGTQFTHVTAVLFGTVRSPHVQVLGTNRLRATVPLHVGGVVDVRVLTDHGGTPVAQRARLTYVPPPVISALARDHGDVRGGQRLVLRGADFWSVRTVRFGRQPAQIVAAGARGLLLVVTVPAAQAAGDVPVTVTTGYGTSAPARFTYTAAPAPAPTRASAPTRVAPPAAHRSSDPSPSGGRVVRGARPAHGLPGR